MARRNTVNFLQIENGLQRALAECKANPAAPYAKSMSSRLQHASTGLDEITARADHGYLAWRTTITTRILAAKHLHARFEEIRDELGEYGVDVEPSGRVSYWEPDPLVDANSALLGCLGRHIDDVPEAAQWSAELHQFNEALTKARKEEDQALRDYQRVAPLRRQAIYSAMHAVEEYGSLRSDYK